MLKLENNIKVYVPVIRGREGNINHIRDKMSKEFGGTTEYKAKGSWIDDAGKTIFDDIIVIQSFTDKTISDIKWFTATIDPIIKLDLKQKATSIEINNTLYII